MPEFKVQCQYYGERKNKFFSDKKMQNYHKFSVTNADDLPDKYFRSLWRGEIGGRSCWLWISEEITKKASINWEKDQDYCFLMRLGENRTSAFKVKDFIGNLHPENCNNMVLKTKEYWENTVQKIGFWGSENYFYEVNKKQKNPPQNQNNNSQSENNKSIWKKIIWICLPVLFFFACLFLLVKWISKKEK